MIGKAVGVIHYRAKKLGIPKRNGMYYFNLEHIAQITNLSNSLTSLAKEFNIEVKRLRNWIICAKIGVHNADLIRKMAKLKLTGEYTWKGIIKRLQR